MKTVRQKSPIFTQKIGAKKIEIPIKTYKIGQIIENNNPGGVSGGLFKEP